MKDKLDKLNVTAKRYGINILGEASIEDISNFEEWLTVSFKYNTKMSIRNFYKVCNGFDFNGLVIYSLDKKRSNNIYDLNEDWHYNENLRDYIFFADYDIAWYCFDRNNLFFCELDKPSGILMNKFDGFQEMILSAIDMVM